MVRPWSCVRLHLNFVTRPMVNLLSSLLYAACVSNTCTGSTELHLLKALLTSMPSLSSQEYPYMFCPAGNCEVPSHWSLSAAHSCDAEDIWNDVGMQCVYSSEEYNSPARKNLKSTQYTTRQAFKTAVVTDTLEYGYSSVTYSNVPSEDPKDKRWNIVRRR
jgi:hypothetical protein